MPTPVTLGVFATAALALLLIPGPAVMFIVTRSATHGRRVGLASVLGVHTGTLVHIVAATAGLSALLVRSATLFTAVKLVGAGYLVFLGVARLLAPHAPPDAARAEAVSAASAYRQGVVVNVLNPKTALFFLAFVPQFLDARRGGVATQTVVLGLTFVVIGLFTDSAYAVLASRLGTAWRRRRRRSAGPRLAGLVYIGLGITAALTRRSTRPA